MRTAPRLPVACLSIILGCGTWNSVGAEIFAFRDNRGIVHFSNKQENPRWTPLPIPRSVPRPALHSTRAKYPFARIIALQALQAGIDVALVRAIIKVESNFDPQARSRKGAIGLMQVMPETAQLYGVTNLSEPVANIRVGVRHLKLLLEKFQNNLRLTLAAYNAGVAAVTEHGGVPPFPETIAYIGRVLQHYRNYKGSPHR